MLGMGWFEIFVIVIVALVVIGPDKLPEVARGLAKGLRSVQKLVGEIRDTINLDEFDQQVRSEVDKSFNPPKGNSHSSGKTASSHPNFDGYDSDIDEDDDPYAPVVNTAAPASVQAVKKKSGDQQS
jgi:sec-independent protein translocase protein TatB